MPQKEVTINAEGKKLGRMATEVAHILQGKHDPSYNPRLPGDTVVVIENPEKISVSGNKEEQKIYYSHSKRPGKLRAVPYEDMFQDNPEKVIKLAVKNMLPKNRLRKKRLKRLKFTANNK